MNEELPLDITSEPKEIGHPGETVDVYAIETANRRRYIYKEIRPDARQIKIYPGSTLEEKAASMRNVYQIIKNIWEIGLLIQIILSLKIK